MNSYTLSINALLLTILVPLSIHGASTTESKTAMSIVPKKLNIYQAPVARDKDKNIILFLSHGNKEELEMLQVDECGQHFVARASTAVNNLFEVDLWQLITTGEYKKIATRYYKDQGGKFCIEAPDILSH